MDTYMEMERRFYENNWVLVEKREGWNWNWYWYWNWKDSVVSKEKGVGSLPPSSLLCLAFKVRIHKHGIYATVLFITSMLCCQ